MCKNYKNKKQERVVFKVNSETAIESLVVSRFLLHTLKFNQIQFAFDYNLCILIKNVLVCPRMCKNYKNKKQGRVVFKVNSETVICESSTRLKGYRIFGQNDWL